MAAMVMPSDHSGRTRRFSGSAKEGGGAMEFLRVEHTKTLSSLRSEIAELRRRNADLTLKAAMYDSKSEELAEAQAEAAELRSRVAVQDEQVSRVCVQLTEARVTVETLQDSTAAAEQQAADSRQQLEAQEAESARNRELIKALKAELDDRSANSARLMVQLHKVKVQYKEFVENQDSPSGSAHNSAHTSPAHTRRVVAQAPTPPSQPRVQGEAVMSPSPPKAASSQQLSQLRSRLMRRRTTGGTEASLGGASSEAAPAPGGDADPHGSEPGWQGLGPGEHSGSPRAQPQPQSQYDDRSPSLPAYPAPLPNIGGTG